MSYSANKFAVTGANKFANTFTKQPSFLVYNFKKGTPQYKRLF
jgi:hypothetical protein